MIFPDALLAKILCISGSNHLFFGTFCWSGEADECFFKEYF
jgi:hypothetical protein